MAKKECPHNKKTKKSSKKLSKPLDIVEFYCLTCKCKRKIRGVSDITISTTKNDRKLATSSCNKKNDPKCTRKLTKFLSNEQAERISKMKKQRSPLNQ